MQMRSAIGIVLTAAILGCVTSEPIQNVTSASIIAPPGRNLSMRDVATAIERAGKSLGWQLDADGPGLFTGRLALRSHLAVVEIEHDTRSYSIRYRDSRNLDAKEGEIHKAYNEWVEKLDQAIRAQLQMP
jgi:hypothetical protein